MTYDDGGQPIDGASHVRVTVVPATADASCIGFPAQVSDSLGACASTVSAGFARASAKESTRIVAFTFPPRAVLAAVLSAAELEFNQWVRLRDMPLPVHGVYGFAFVNGVIWASGGGTSIRGSFGGLQNQVFFPTVSCD